MITYKAFKFRLYPTNEQELTLVQWIGCGRYIWNHFLQKNIEKYKFDKKFIFKTEMSADVVKLKKELTWLNEPPAFVLLNKLTNLETALKRAFKKISSFPTFKSKHSDTSGISIGQLNNHIKFCQNSIIIPKIGPIKYIKHRNITGEFKSITIRKQNNRWFVICLCKITKDITNKSDIILGIDLGIKEFAITSDGQIFDNPRHMEKKQKLLTRRQRQLSKKQKHSNRREKKRRQISKLHYHVRMQRHDYLHQTSREITNSCDILVLENLNIKGMMKNKNLSRSIGQVGWSTFINYCKYKIEDRGGSLFLIDRFYPSSQLCSCCGSRKKMLLSQRTYECNNCGLVLDRDFNAAINIKKYYTTHGTWGSYAHGENDQSIEYSIDQVNSMKCEKFFINNKEAVTR